MSLFIDFKHSQTMDETADNFGRKLFDLVFKADEKNKDNLAKGFPAHVALVRWWMAEPSEPTDEAIQKKAEFLENYCGGGLQGWPH